MKIEKEAEEKIRKILKKEEAGELKDGNTVVFDLAISIENVVDVAEKIRKTGVVVGKTEIGNDESILTLGTAKGFN